MAKHTPGPWFINYDPDDGRPLEIATADRDHRIAFLASNGNAADAILIAAAPDLLAALQALYDETADYMRINNLGDPSSKHNMRNAAAAIARAGCV